MKALEIAEVTLRYQML